MGMADPNLEMVQLDKVEKDGGLAGVGESQPGCAARAAALGRAAHSSQNERSPAGFIDRGEEPIEPGQVAKAVAGDVAALLVFAAIGRLSHGESLDGEVLATALPFLLGWLGTAPFLGGYGRAALGTDLKGAALAAAKCWAAGIPLGLVLRGVSKARPTAGAMGNPCFSPTGSCAPRRAGLHPADAVHRRVPRDDPRHHGRLAVAPIDDAAQAWVSVGQPQGQHLRVLQPP